MFVKLHQRKSVKSGGGGENFHFAATDFLKNL